MSLDALGKVIAAIEARAQADIATEFIVQAYGMLSPANPVSWNRDGFYTAQEMHSIAEYGYPVPNQELEFPVPQDCPFWGAAFNVGKEVFRPMLRRAWVELPRGAGTGIVAVRSLGEQRLSIEAFVGDARLTPVQDEGEDWRLHQWQLGDRARVGLLHLSCDSLPVLSGSHGRISCFVSQPFWRG